MKKREVIKYALINSFGTATYIALISLFISLLDGWIIDGGNDIILTPIFILMLFVFSAALTGSLVFGRPILWYIDGKKRDSVSLLFYTLSSLLVLTVIIFLFLLVINI